MRPSARLVAIVVGVALVAGGLLADRNRPAPSAAAFGTIIDPGMPAEPPASALSSTWFCPGAPASTDAPDNGVVSVLNPTDATRQVALTAYPRGGEPVTRSLSVPGNGRVDVRLADVAPADLTATLVEASTGQLAVEQTIVSSRGRSPAPCASQASTEWDVAAGATTADARLRLSLFNPFADDATVDFSFVTEEGQRADVPALSGKLVKAGTVELVAIDQAVRRDAQVSVRAVTRRGRLVVGRVQTFDGSAGKVGLVASLAAPGPGPRWWFPAGEKGSGIGEQLVLFNPSETNAAQVDLSLYPDDRAAAVHTQSVVVDAGATTVVDLGADDGVATGTHQLLVDAAQAPVVAELVQTYGEGSGRTGTAVVLGSRLTSARWLSPVGVAGEGDGLELTIANPTGVDVEVTVGSLGIGGFVPLSSANAVTIAPAATLRLDVASLGEVAGQPLVVRASAPVVVARQYVRADGSRVSATVVIPGLDERARTDGGAATTPDTAASPETIGGGTVDLGGSLTTAPGSAAGTTSPAATGAPVSSPPATGAGSATTTLATTATTGPPSSTAASTAGASSSSSVAGQPADPSTSSSGG